ncbi:hypothetical protein [Umezawaea sp. Da 62-37]|uniref:hypothetical protein n=1 Tax=Umezawaea sp. Da 62-37 TaxID=3075927 RepID=UPI0028F6E624|nr:hypothetical protein [Umezawaea sp. Da 62-37]WNV86624.1 hypothetical protein RM788_52355 [Umezawaea sp. Da 62-37]
MGAKGLVDGIREMQSIKQRIGYAVAGVAGLVCGGVVVLVLATEPDLSPWAKSLFGLLVVIGLTWAVFAVWALTGGVPRFGQDQVVAAWLGVATAAWCALGALAFTLVRGKVEPTLLVVVFALGMAAAIGVLSARRTRAVQLDRARRRAEEGPRAPNLHVWS